MDALLDRAPHGMDEEVERICVEVPGVLECRRARVRVSGPEMFLDVVVTVEQGTSLDEAHHIADAVEQALSRLGPSVDCIVHVEPSSIGEIMHDEIDVYTLLHSLARREPDILGVHKVRIQKTESDTYIAADLEMPSTMTVETAHKVTDRLEEQLKELIPNLQRVTLHIDVEHKEHTDRNITTEREDMILEITEIVKGIDHAHDCHGIVITEGKSGLTVSLDCYVDASLTLGESHEISETVEKCVRKRYPEVDIVFVHTEPK
jgi:divalent metal cation (Fe/Co/Zn/Cd) transporter